MRLLFHGDGSSPRLADPASARRAVSPGPIQHAIANPAAALFTAFENEDAGLRDDQHEQHHDDGDRGACEVLVPDGLGAADDAYPIQPVGQHEEVGHDKNGDNDSRDENLARSK